ncbi:MAG: hypothetical protein P8I94_03255 [Emcibacteraceae bacterium]|nr:hypothetical protein [Emcibacteraceae bacterium]
MNMKSTIVPKSDQLNADDLINSEMTIVITSVSIVNGDQPVLVHYQNDNGRPYKPNKTMRKVMVALWGEDEAQYTGRAMTLFTNPEVKWAGQAVGGLEIKAMSHIQSNANLNLTATRGKKRKINIAKLEMEQQAPPMFDPKQFDADFPAMSEAIKNGSDTAKNIIGHLAQYGQLTDEQVSRLTTIKKDK